MQSLSWYARRLCAMSAAELAWRLRSKCKEVLDRRLIARRQRPIPWNEIVSEHADRPLTDRRILGNPPSLSNGHAMPGRWRELLAAADRIVERRLILFDLDHSYPGSRIDWNHEPKAGVATPMCASSLIDYRDHALTGDCKFVWEPNRHHHLVVLARAFRVTGDEKYARAALEQLESWIQQCPYGVGMNWRSPLELGLRIINWAWTLGLLEGSEALTAERMRRIVPVAHRHLWEIQRNYSRFSSANNHLIGEAAGVFIGSCYFVGLKGAAKWRKQSREILTREIIAQTYADGGSREQAMGYQLFVMQFLMLAGLAARQRGEDFPASYWDRLEAMFDFLSAMKEGGPLPMFGDGDDGYVLDLGGRDDTACSLLAVGAMMFNRPDLAVCGQGFREPAWWLFGEDGRLQFETLRMSDRPKREEADTAAQGRRGTGTSRGFSDSGLYLLQRGRTGQADHVSVLFDCGELGFQSIAAHGHADALSFTVRAGGHDVLVDPGTYDYFTHPAWRKYFRSTRAHNTAVIDGQDQSEMLGPFLWGHRARARLLNWIPTELGGTVRAEHDGYRRPADPITHRRTVCLEGRSPVLTVHDEIISTGCHDVAFYWHFSEHCRVTPKTPELWEVQYPGGTLRVEFAGELSVTQGAASSEPILGWISRGYHQKTPAPTLVARVVTRGTRSFTTRMSLPSAVPPGRREPKRRKTTSMPVCGTA